MNKEADYNIVLTGDLLPDFEAETVAVSFATLFQISSEKAGQIIQSRMTIKTGISLDQAHAYQSKLASIGVEAIIENRESIVESSGAPDSARADVNLPDKEKEEKLKARQAERANNPHAEEADYNIALTGDLLPDFDAETVTASFATLFQISSEKAGQIIQSPMTIKTGISLDQAHAYQSKLASIGVEAIIQSRESSNESSDRPAPVSAQAKPDLPDQIVCPKCEAKQPAALKCRRCGIDIKKYLQEQEKLKARLAEKAKNPQPEEAEEEADVAVNEPKGGLTSVLSTTAIAILSVFFWYGVAVGLGFEVGAAALIVGGMIGLVSVKTGGKGPAFAVLCSLLIVLSVLGGKFLAAQYFEVDLNDVISKGFIYEGTSLKSIYDEEILDAQTFISLRGDESSIRDFMIERGYSDRANATEITIQELTLFREELQPRLEEIAIGELTFDEWRDEMVDEEITNTPIHQSVIKSFDLTNILFLLSGIAIAIGLVLYKPKNQAVMES